MDPQAVFIKRFGDLVALLRQDPGNDAAQDLALTAAAAAVARAAVSVDGGVDHGFEDDDTLQGRMRARGIDSLHVAAGAEPHELLQLARALSHDRTPLPTLSSVRVELVRPVVPPSPAGSAFAGEQAPSPRRGEHERRRWVDRRVWTGRPYQGVERRRRGERRVAGERRRHVARRYAIDIGLLLQRLAQTCRSGTWLSALHVAFVLHQYLLRVPVAERRALGIMVRRHLPRTALGGIIDAALRDPTERSRAAAVLRWMGLDGAEAMLAEIRRSEIVGPREFLHDALGGMPEAFPLVVPLFTSEAWHEIRHAAGLAGRMHRREAIPLLERHVDHADERVRAAALEALAAFPLADVADALRRGLNHPSAPTRAAAAATIARTRAAGFAMPLMAALEQENDPQAWVAMVQALGAIGSSEACTALVAIALERRTLLGRGHPVARRLEAVAALAAAGGPHGHAGLERIANQGDDEIAAAAAAALAAC